MNDIAKTKQEKRIRLVVVLSFVIMLAEVGTGLLSKSMALLANGIHMGAHVLIIGLNWLAYIVVRRLRKRGNEHYDPDKILNLSAFTSGILLLMVVVFIIVETAERMQQGDAQITNYEFALTIAAIGLVGNGVCAMILHDKKGEGDNNSHAAYLHLLADVLTKFGAIAGIACAMIWNITWIDAAVAIVSAVVMGRWAQKLLWDTGRILTRK